MIEFKPKTATGNRGLGVVMLVVWGIGGLALSLFALLGAPTLTAISIILMWIGGVLFFGMCALMADISYRLSGPSLPVYMVNPPRPDSFNEEYRGIPYMLLESGLVVAEFADGTRTFKNWKKFVEAVGDASA